MPARQPDDRVGRCDSNARALFESAGIPFAITDLTRRTVVFRQGDPSGSVIFVERGRVLLAVTARNGKEAVCGLAGPGEFIGEDALCGQDVRRQTATAITAATVFVIAKADMSRLIQARSPIGDRFIAHVLARNARLEADLTYLILHSSEQRLARTLLLLADGQGRRPRWDPLPALSQEIIAEMVGTTRSRVNSFMGKFKKLGFIEMQNGRLKVNPSLASVVYGAEAS